MFGMECVVSSCRRLEACNRYREQVRALRASKARRLDVEDDDPLKPVYLPPQAPTRGTRHRNPSLQEEAIPKETEATSAGLSARSTGMISSEEGDITVKASTKHNDRRPILFLDKTYVEGEGEKTREEDEKEKRKKKLSGIEEAGEREGDDQSSCNAAHLSKLPDDSDDKSSALLVVNGEPPKRVEEISDGSRFSSIVWGPAREPYLDRNTTYILPSYDIQEGVIVRSSDGRTLYSPPTYYYSSSEGISYSSGLAPMIRYYPYDAIEPYPIVQTETSRGGGEQGFSHDVTGGVYHHTRRADAGRGVGGG